MRDSTTLTKPPEGVIAGSSVPRENEKLEREEREAVERMVAQMKMKEAYRQKGEDELREISKEKLL